MDSGTVQAGIAVVAGLVAINTFSVNALIRVQLARLNGRYVQTPLFDAKHQALNAKLDSMQAYQVEHFKDLKEQISSVVLGADSAGKERTGILSRLAVVEVLAGKK